jgi:hypothetical protein
MIDDCQQKPSTDNKQPTTKFIQMTKIKFNLRNVVAIAICLAVVSVAFTGCFKNDTSSSDPNDGPPGSVKDILSNDLLAKVKDLGIEINDGNTPPNIEGTYLLSPYVYLKSNFDDKNYSYKPGDILPNLLLTFSNQDNDKHTIKVSYINQVGVLRITNPVAFVTGSGNKFTVFAEENLFPNSSDPYKSVFVYSGEIAPAGINNYHEVEITTREIPNNSLKKGSARLYYDSDGISQKQ